MLLCLPQAGSGCGQFRAWQTLLGPCVSVVGVQLPGRESRWADPPVSTVDEAVDAVVRELRDVQPAEQPFVVFGHSFGGLLGYEIARRLARPQDTLVIAASRPPHMCGQAAGSLGAPDDDQRLVRMLDVRGLGEDDMDTETRELMLDLLRQDALLSATYQDPGGATVRCAVEVWGGVSDDSVTAEHLDGWRPYCAGPFRHREFPGGHHFFVHQAESLLPVMQELITGS